MASPEKVFRELKRIAQKPRFELMVGGCLVERAIH
jgi:hypothetical protein